MARSKTWLTSSSLATLPPPTRSSRPTARHEGRLAPRSRRTLEEQLLAIQARLRPAHRILRRLQRVGAQVLAALWPGEVIPRIPSRTADWLEVAVGRFEAWKASAARPAIIQQASAIADYTDTSAFAPEVDDNGVAQPEEWFGLNPADDEDSAEEIDSSDEGEEEEEGEDAAPDGGAAGQPQLDRASSSKAHAGAPPAAGDDQTETRQPATPPAGGAVSTDQPGSPAAPLVQSAASTFLFHHFWNSILLSLHNSIHWGCIRTILTTGLLGALCVNIIMHAFGFPLFFAFHLLAVSFAALPWLPPSQPDNCSAICGWGSAWEGNYSSFVGL
ncbi:uncharacterized protein [Aegilops tauschii subsp. strangulata]|uniref:uncharacterized protein isoform X1 n=1 Tax=Aegilops tauschii subsp. strangulata TaxID=200361 RepID=UPI003CC866FD